MQAAIGAVRLPVPGCPSAEAFTIARKKLRPAFFKVLHSHLLQAFSKTKPKAAAWKGRRLLAVDGCRFTLPRSKKLWERFGGPTGSAWPQTTVTLLFDVLGRVATSFALGPFAEDERAALLTLIPDMIPNDVVLLDRGYVSFEVLCRLVSAKVDFVMRVPIKGTFSQVLTFARSGRIEEWLVLDRPKNAPQDLPEHLRVRIVRRQKRPGRGLFVLTSLTEHEAAAPKVLWLYRQRWQIEDEYRCWKSNARVERQFHAKSPEGVEQEVWGKLIYYTLSRLLFASASKRGRMAFNDIRVKEGFTRITVSLIVLILGSPIKARSVLLELLEGLTARRYRRRQDRSYPRRSLSPFPKWGPRGRRSRRKYG